MMIFATFIFLVTINCSANGLTTRTVTTTISFVNGVKESVMLKAEDTYDENEGTGTLTICRDTQAAVVPGSKCNIQCNMQCKILCVNVAKRLDGSLYNAGLVKNYYFNTPIPMGMTISEASEEAIHSKVFNTEDDVELQILPFVKGKFVPSIHEGDWKVEIPYRKHGPAVVFTEVTTQLILHNNLTKAFCCTMISSGQDEIWLSLKIKKANAPKGFMDLKFENNAIFLDLNKQLEEKSIDPKQAPGQSVVQANIGYMQELDDEYYAEISLHNENIVVKITTEDTAYAVRFVHGFGNKEGNKIMFFRGSKVSVPATKEGEGKVTVKHDVSWAFTGATSLQVSTIRWKGDKEKFSDIKFAKLDEEKFRYTNGVGTLMVLPWPTPLEPLISRIVGSLKSDSEIN